MKDWTELRVLVYADFDDERIDELTRLIASQDDVVMVLGREARFAVPEQNAPSTDTRQ